MRHPQHPLFDQLCVLLDELEVLVFAMEPCTLRAQLRALLVHFDTLADRLLESERKHRDE